MDFSQDFNHTTPHHSTDTALVKDLNDTPLNTDDRKDSVLVLLDVSAAPDTIDRLEKWLFCVDR